MSSEKSLPWKIEYDSKVLKDVKKIPRDIAEKITLKIEKQLSLNPYAGLPLTGKFKGLYRYRFGNYRVIYEIKQDRIVILVLHIAHPKDIYDLPI